MVKGKYEVVKIGDIKPYWKNPRTTKDKAVNAVAESIMRYGFNQPIVVDEDNVIVAGQTRYKAAMQLKLSEVPCIKVKFTGKEAKEYRIADNKTNEFNEWDEQLLSVELKELDVNSLDFCFDIKDISRLIDVTNKISHDTIAGQINTGEVIAERVNQELSDYIDVTCPKCGEDFFIRESALQTRRRTK